MSHAVRAVVYGLCPTSYGDGKFFAGTSADVLAQATAHLVEVRSRSRAGTSGHSRSDT